MRGCSSKFKVARELRERVNLRVVLRYAVAGLLILVPVYPKFPLVAVPGTYVSVRLEDWVILGVGLVWLAYVVPRWRKFLAEPTNRAVIVYWLVGLVSLVSAIWITRTVVWHLGFLHAVRRVEYLLLFLVVVSTIKSLDDVWFYLQTAVVALFLVFGYGFGQKFLGWPVISTMNKEFAKGVAMAIAPGDRINATFAGHYDLAVYSVVMLNLLVGLVVASRRGRARLIYMVAVGVSFWLLLASASRISFAAYLGSITLTLWWLKKRWWIPPVVTVSLLLSFLTPSLTTRYAETIRYELVPRLAKVSVREFLPLESEKVTPMLTVTPVPTKVAEKGRAGVTGVGKEREPVPTATLVPTPTTVQVVAAPVEYAPAFEDRSTSIRFNVEWPRAVRAFVKNPLLGTGYSSITLATDNDYLRLLGEIGVLGFWAFGMIFGYLFLRVRGILFGNGVMDARRVVAVGIFGGMLGFVANAMFIDVFEASKAASYFWMLAGVMVGTSLVQSSKVEVKS